MTASWVTPTLTVPCIHVSICFCLSSTWYGVTCCYFYSLIFLTVLLFSKCLGYTPTPLSCYVMAPGLWKVVVQAVSMCQTLCVCLTQQIVTPPIFQQLLIQFHYEVLFHHFTSDSGLFSWNFLKASSVYFTTKSLVAPWKRIYLLQHLAKQTGAYAAISMFHHIQPASRCYNNVFCTRWTWLPLQDLWWRHWGSEFMTCISTVEWSTEQGA